MIEECNFKSKIKHRDMPGCNLTPTDIICPGEEDCILFQIYQILKNQDLKVKNEGFIQ
ncbi:MAG: hypothetical protein JSU91_08165 [Thermoplasmatales archaeon]|nr:MAG: hypothetical protein JSU91_08165 [Thermoplasmatales archaeon]